MEEDINVIEKLLKIFEMLRKDDEEGHSSAYELQWEDIQAIENLIARNKDYEEGKALSKKQEVMILKAIEKSAEEQITKELKNYISKSKVKEKIEELDKKKRKSQIEYSTIDELIFDKKIEVLQELLED